MTDEELLASLDRHFLRGNAWLTGAQFGEHRDRDSCAQCDELVRMVRDVSQAAYA